MRALARSDAAAAKVEALGAEAVRGDLDDRARWPPGGGLRRHLPPGRPSRRLGALGGLRARQRRGHANALDACAEAGVGRFVHCGTEAALIAGEPLVGVDETAPLRPGLPRALPGDQGAGRAAVRGANRDGFETVVLRPRFVWGKGDTTLLPEMIETVEAGQFAWIGGGRNVTDTDPRRQRRRGPGPGRREGPPRRGLLRHRRRAGRLPRVRHRDAAHAGRRAAGPQPARRGPRAPLARVCEAAWKLLPLPGEPPMTTFRSWLLTQECTIDIAKAREELGTSRSSPRAGPGRAARIRDSPVRSAQPIRPGWPLPPASRRCVRHQLVDAHLQVRVEADQVAIAWNTSWCAPGARCRQTHGGGSPALAVSSEPKHSINGVGVVASVEAGAFAARSSTIFRYVPRSSIDRAGLITDTWIPHRRTS